MADGRVAMTVSEAIAEMWAISRKTAGTPGGDAIDDGMWLTSKIAAVPQVGDSFTASDVWSLKGPAHVVSTDVSDAEMPAMVACRMGVHRPIYVRFGHYCACCGISLGTVSYEQAPLFDEILAEITLQKESVLRKLVPTKKELKKYAKSSQPLNL